MAQFQSKSCLPRYTQVHIPSGCFNLPNLYSINLSFPTWILLQPSNSRYVIPLQWEEKNILSLLPYYSHFEETTCISRDLKFRWIILLLSFLLNALPDSYFINFPFFPIVMTSYRKVEIIGTLISMQIGSSF